jgi:hypothetical protein
MDIEGNASGAQVENLRIGSLTYLLISLAITLVIGLQAAQTFRILCPPQSLAALSFLRVACPPAFYPFLDYPLYNQAHYSGEKINQFKVIGILVDNREVPILPEDMGLRFWLFQRFIDAVNQEKREQIAAYVEMYQSRHDRQITALRLENHPLILSGKGVLQDTPIVWKVYRLEETP